MFVRENLDQFRNTNADVQMFYENSIWLKPPGVSQVYMLLIGGGGNGSSTSGGGSGAVTKWWGSAINVPDNLVVSVSNGNLSNSTVSYRGSGVTTLLTASGASGVTGASAMTNNFFGASGFFESVAGQAGSTSSVTASTTTFLSGGADTGGDTVTANYGYTTPASGNGNFFLQPIMVGLGGAGGGQGGIGCGSGRSGVGGPGLVIIASW